MGYRVDTVPWPLRPLYLAVTWTLGLLFYLYYVVCRLTSRVSISPDGPYGPPRALKKGVLHVALHSGVPIVPLTIACKRFLPIKSWDSKKFPLPFNRITVTVHEPVLVARENFDDAGERVVDALECVAHRLRPVVASHIF